MPTDARVFYSVALGTPEQNGAWIVDVLAGVLGEPVRIAESISYPIDRSPDGRWMVDDVTVGSRVWLRLMDRDAVPPVPASVIDLDEAVDYPGIGRFRFASGATAVAVGAGGSEGDDLYTLALGDDGPGVPWQVDAELPDTTHVDEFDYLPGDEQLVLVTHDELTDTAAIVLAPARADAPAGFVPIVAALADEGLGAPDASSDGRLLAYRVVSDAAARGYVVDLDALPAAPVELVRPSEDVQLIDLQIAPDDSGVLYAVRVEMEPQDESWCYWSALEDGALQPPIELTPDHAWVQSANAWSPDARWMALLAVGEPNTRLLVRLDDGVPSTPFELGPVVDSLGDPRRAFTSDGWYYYLTEMGSDQAFMRVDVTGDEPGTPQLVHAAGDILDYELSADASTLVLASADTFAGAYQGFAIDLSTTRPGAPVRFDEPMAADDWVYRVDVTPNGRGITYERRPEASGRYGHYVDLATPGVALTLAEGLQISGIDVRALP